MKRETQGSQTGTDCGGKALGLPSDKLRNRGVRIFHNGNAVETTRRIYWSSSSELSKHYVYLVIESTVNSRNGRTKGVGGNKDLGGVSCFCFFWFLVVGKQGSLVLVSRYFCSALSVVCSMRFCLCGFTFVTVGC